MQLATGTSDQADPRSAVDEAYGRVRSRLVDAPQLVVAYASAHYDTESVAAALRAAATGAPIHGGTSCHGVMSEAGFRSDAEGRGLGLLGIHDPGGAYGVGSAEIGASPRAAAVEAAKQSIQAAGRPGELPTMVWLTGPPGVEEEVLEGLMGYFGPNVPICGGSSADEDVSGNWSQFTHLHHSRHAVVVTVLYPSSPIAYAFQGGYDVTDRCATVTRGNGRLVAELDGRPAANVYNEWIGGALSDLVGRDANVLMRTSLHPLGRLVGKVGGTPYFQLSHPDTVTTTGGLTLFTNVEAGDKFHLMAGSEEALVTRTRRIVESALRNWPEKNPKIAGALLVYCAGCMLTVLKHMPEVVAHLQKSLGEDTPFLGAFSFGEQGSFRGGENRHGNLMISVVLFLE